MCLTGSNCLKLETDGNKKLAAYERSPFEVNLEGKWRFQLLRDGKGIIPRSGDRERKDKEAEFYSLLELSAANFSDTLKAQPGFQPEALTGQRAHLQIPRWCLGRGWGQKEDIQNPCCPLLERRTLEVADVPQFPSNKVPGESQPGRTLRDPCSEVYLPNLPAPL